MMRDKYSSMTIPKIIQEARNLYFNMEDELNKLDLDAADAINQMSKIDSDILEDSMREKNSNNMEILEKYNREYLDIGMAILSKSVFRLIGTRSDSFYGHFLQGLQKRISLVQDRPVRIDYSPIGFYLTINPVEFCKIVDNAEQSIALIEVECLKLIRRYPIVFSKELSNPTTMAIMEMATDIAVTQAMNESESVFYDHLPAEVIQIDSIEFRELIGFKHVERNQTAVYYYNLLLESLGDEISNLSLLSESTISINNLLELHLRVRSGAVTLNELENLVTNDTFRNLIDSLDGTTNSITQFKEAVQRYIRRTYNEDSDESEAVEMTLMDMYLKSINELDDEIDYTDVDEEEENVVLTTEIINKFNENNSKEIIEVRKKAKTLKKDLGQFISYYKDLKVVDIESLEILFEVIEKYPSKVEDVKLHDIVTLSTFINNARKSLDIVSLYMSTIKQNPTFDLLKHIKTLRQDIYSKVIDTMDTIREQDKMGFDTMLVELVESAKVKSKGIVPGDADLLIQSVKEKSKMNWKNVLRSAIGQGNRGVKRTHNRLNRRLPNRLELSGRTRGYTEGRVIVAMDTSGSMSDAIIRKILNEVRHITDTFEVHAELIQFDSEVRHVHSIEKAEDLSDYIEGRGGTRFQSVFDYLDVNAKEKGYKKKDDILLFFSDGYGEPKVDTLGMKKVFWVRTEGYLSVTNPVGKVMDLIV